MCNIPQVTGEECMRAYPQEFRDRVLAALGRGEKCSEIAQRLEVSVQFVYGVRDRMVLEDERGSRRVGGYRQSVIADMQSTITDWLKAEPDLTLHELCDRLAAQGRLLKVPALWHQLNNWGLSFKNPARQRARARRRTASTP
jgi:transposase